MSIAEPGPFAVGCVVTGFFTEEAADAVVGLLADTRTLSCGSFLAEWGGAFIAVRAFCCMVEAFAGDFFSVSYF